MESFQRKISQIKQLAKEKCVPIEISKVNLGNYKACGIIKKLLTHRRYKGCDEY